MVALSSVVSARGANRQSLYSGNRASIEEAYVFFTNEFLNDEVRINFIVSGAVRTDMLIKLESESPGIENRKKTYYPLGVIQVDEICELIEFLLSDSSRFMSGVSFPVDSGYLL